MEITQKILKKIVELHENGFSPKSISKIITDYSESQIRNFLKKEGKHNNHMYTEDELSQIIFDYNNHMSFVELGQKYNRHPNSIAYKLKSLGIHTPKIKRQFNCDEVKSIITEKGFFLLGTLYDNMTFDDDIVIIDDKGYKYNPRVSYLFHDVLFEKFHPNNKFTIENINNFFKHHRNDEYECLVTEYTGNNIEMDFKHKTCKTVFKATWQQMQGKLSENGKDKYYKSCPKCYKHKIESYHALILKQVFKHEYPDTETEERSCINPDTGYALPTDIVNHKLKIAIEIQSGIHDRYNKHKIDIFKKNFWLKQGYSFYDPDIRNYSIIEMIQLFFPELNDIPSYVDYSFANCVDFNVVQEYLNNGYLLKEISNIMNVNYNTLASLITSKKCFLPNDYKKRSHNIKSIIRLSINGDFLKKYDTLTSIEEDGFATGTIRRVLKNEQDFAYDSYWVYEDDYITQNYTIPELPFDKFTLPVAKYDEDDHFICNYETIYEAEKYSASSRNEIYRVAKGDRKTSRHERWKFI